MPNINEGLPRIFSNGGQIKITKSATEHILLNYEGGLRIKVPGREAIPIHDRNALTAVLEGPDRPCEIGFQARYVHMQGAAEAVALFAGNGSDGQKVKVSIEIEILDFRGSSNHESWTWADCYLPEGYEISDPGPSQPMLVDWMFHSLTAAPTLAGV